MIVLDASVLIAHLDESDVHHQATEIHLTNAQDDDLGVSPVTLAEVLVLPARVGRATETKEAIGSIGVVELSLPVDAAEQLALLRSQTGLRLPDCCVLLAAIEAEGSVLTFDDRLARAAADLGLGS